MEKTCLLDLPILPKDRDDACGTEVILTTYLSERNAISSAEGLKNFISRWKRLWFLSGNYEELLEEEKLTVDNSFNHEEVYNLILRKHEDLDFKDPNVSIVANILIPRPLMQAVIIANKYGVGSDLAMVRLYLDPYPEYDDRLRFGCDVNYANYIEEILDK